ncbi:MAG TPA: PhzF family phenazine biosynthesis protein [Burkholderiales bacterium]|nr:PhzF family phenazine biosynthesis protein [Burkholderiales bacterium]
MRRFQQIDVFTGRPFLGNPVAVVLEGEGLSGDDMQRIARWTNLSETTFLLPSKAGDYRVRIFTPRHELPFAGHPTIGSAYAAIRAGIAKPRNGELKQECGAGVLALRAEGSKIYVRSPRPNISEVKNVAGAFGVPLAPPAHLLKVDVGPVWLVGEMTDARALAALKPDMTALAEWTTSLRASGVTVFAPSGEPDCAIHVRSFAPAGGIMEDPVCGSGNISVAAYLRHFGRAQPSYVARQGMQLGRDGRVYMRVDGDDLWLGGEAVACVEGTLAA